jgi:hypothetical protein
MDRLFLLSGIKGDKSIKLSKEDSKFKRSKEFPGSENLVLAAIALETIDDSKTKYGQAKPYNQRSVIGVLMSVLGWDAGSENRANPKDYENWWDDHKKKSEYEQKLIKMISGYVFERIMRLDREQKKTNQEIAEWLRRMAK